MLPIRLGLAHPVAIGSIVRQDFLRIGREAIHFWPASKLAGHGSPANVIANFSQGDLPRADHLSSPVAKNYLLPFEGKSPAYSVYPVPHEGRIAIVTDVGHGMRWTRRRF